MILSLVQTARADSCSRIIAQKIVRRSVVGISILLKLTLSSAHADDKAHDSNKKNQILSAPEIINAYVEEASLRFRIPSSWIWAVIKIESAGDISALSKKGAMGLMQIMPETWLMLRQQYHLGSDPFSAHDNILAGAGYLRDLYERYGDHGVFAAYNAGPGRYEDYLKGRKLLPAETINYTSKLKQWASSELAQGGYKLMNEHNLVSHSDLFIPSPFARSIHHERVDEAFKTIQGTDQKVIDLSALTPSSHGLFVRIADRSESGE